VKLLDTAVLVDIDRGSVDERVRRLDEEGRHAISVVTVTELRLGLEKSYERRTEEYREASDKMDALLSRFDVVDVERRVAVAASRIIQDLRTAGLPLNDLHDIYVAATALTEQLPVLTPNVKHFNRIEGVEVEDWAEY